MPSEAPRLYTRLAQSIFGESSRTEAEEDFRRKKAVDLVLGNKAIPSTSFLVEHFLPSESSSRNLSHNQKVRKAYKDFVREVSTVANESSAQQNASWTMYNILTKRSSHDESLRDIESYFGPIPTSKYEELKRLSMLLEDARQVNTTERNEVLPMPFARFQFSPPALVLPDYAAAVKLNKSKKNDRSSMKSPPVVTSTNTRLNESKKEESRFLRGLNRMIEEYLMDSGSSMTRDVIWSELISIICDCDGHEVESRLFELLGEGGLNILMELIPQIDMIRGMDNITLDNVVRDSLSIESNDRIRNVGENDISFEDATHGMSANQKKKMARKMQKLQRSQNEIIQSDEIINVDQSEKYLRGGISSVDPLVSAGFHEEYLEQERLLGLQGGSTPALASNDWMKNLHAEGTLQYHEKKKPLPKGTTRKTIPGCEIVSIPAAKKVKMPESDLIPVDRLEPWAQLVFPTTRRFNQIQSQVFEVAYNSSENMLVCAPTGAGKTNIALLSFLHLVKSYMTETLNDSTDTEDDIKAEYFLDRSRFKAIYIAPMKALAQEVVTKFSAALKPLGIMVREFTGDMQLTRQEVADSQLIVTTPEKWDVVTRKGGDGSLGTLVNLIIIDEVHLLAEDRGAVIETIVARTQRYIESSQSFIRIVGLSATLPNYEDVAAFLRVNKSNGLFHFGPEYRPVPLDQTFIGVTEKQRVKRNELMNRHAYDKMIDALQKDKQVMIFVHSRRDTSKTIDAMLDLVCKHNTSSFLENSDAKEYSFWKKKVDKSKSIELQNYFAKGVGVHHAGMLRADRNLTEQLYEKGLIKVLCCTATLAWGVNLPGHTVIIKGTELYEPERGGYVDLSILDVFQMFGRAGRPQYDSTGHAVLITAHKSLDTYLGMLSLQAPIESNFVKALPDHLNAEIVNGTISNIKEACEWLSYTYMFVRMGKNPLAYGMTIEEKFSDPDLANRRIDMIKEAAVVLDQCMMIRYSPHSGNLSVTDMGRVASHYYITHGTIESFNTMLTAQLGDSEALHVLCSASEFDQLKVRPEELGEIDDLKKKTSLKVAGAVEDTAGKVNVLLQCYIDHSRVKSFTLISDTNYVAQSAGRISRALFEICLKRGWSSMACLFLSLSKSIDRRVGPNKSVLRQFNELPIDIVQKLENSRADPERLIDMSSGEIGQLVRNQKFGPIIQRLVHHLPHLSASFNVQPITRGVLRLNLELTADFQWDVRHHGQVESFWVWVEDGESEYIYHSEPFLLHRAKYEIPQFLEFTIPVREPIPPQYFLRIVSDRWVGCESVVPISFQHLILPDIHPPHTDLLDIHAVPVTALQNPAFEALYTSKNISFFNPIQSQTFHTLYHTSCNVLVGAPTGSGKTVISELAILQLLKSDPEAKTVYIAPLKALARERISDWKNRLGKALGLSVVELTGDTTPDLIKLQKAHVIITTPEKWDGITRGWKNRKYVRQVGLLVIDEIHLLGVERGPVLEVIVSRMRFIADKMRTSVRFVGLSTALANAKDLAEWLGIPHYIGLYNFRPSVRPIPMNIYIQGFPGKHYCPRMATMNKPAYASILEHSPKKPVLIFVSSRRQTRLTALDLISYCASDDNPKQFLHMPEEEVYNIAETLRDNALKDTIVFGVGIHHAGLDNHDRNIVETLFVEGKIQILVCTSTLAWGVNFPAHLVIVKGTEYFDGKTGKYVDFPVTDVLQMMGRAGRPQFDDTGVACIFVHEPKKNFYKKFLHEPFPVESSLHKCLHNHLNAEIANGRVDDVIGCVDYLSWTYFFRRLLRNPSYYGLESTDDDCIQTHLMNLIKNTLHDLLKEGCIETIDDGDQDAKLTAKSFTIVDSGNWKVRPTFLGSVASLYYLDYRTVGYFRKQISILEEHEKQSHEPPSFESLTFILSKAMEFSELPVRHNEEHLNADLASSLPWDTSQMDMENSHTKSYLLLQAHIFRATLPISDYVTDTKSVLDQAPRVLNALIDIAAEKGILEITLRLLRLSQMIYQALPEDASQLLQLPHVTFARCDSIEKGYGLASKKKRSISTLKDMLSMDALIAKERVESAFANVRSKYTYKSKDVEELLGYLASLPQYLLQIEATSREFTSSKESAKDGCVQIEVSAISSAMEIKVTILPRSSSQVVASVKDVYCPRYHKSKKLSWFLVLGCATTGELVAMQRIGALSKRPSSIDVFSTSLSFNYSLADGLLEYITFLVPDCIYGLEVIERFSLVLKPIAKEVVS